MVRRPPRATRPDTLFPYTTLFRSIVSSLTYNEDNGTPVGGDYGDELDILADQQQGGSDYGDDCNDCADDQQPIFGAGFVASVNDSDGSESLKRIAIATTTEQIGRAAWRERTSQYE